MKQYACILYMYHTSTTQAQVIASTNYKLVENLTICMYSIYMYIHYSLYICMNFD